ncbi:MAG: CRISPR-associated protein Cas4 [Phycisphaerae bacterium]|jgi:CRISPR-associated exonuclease Cas4
MFFEDQLISISALQHWLFCHRQCGLIHLEQIWIENQLTAEGRVLHEKVHQANAEFAGDARIVRGLRLVSFQLGLVGQADVVEFHKSDKGIVLPGSDNLWQPFPVEYKRGKPKKNNSDCVQLCAQAMCLEEMLNTEITFGAFYYQRPRRRTEVEFTTQLHGLVEDISQSVHEMIDGGITPRGDYEQKCKNCSLAGVCMPKTTGVDKKIDYYLSKAGNDEGLIE